MAWGIAVQRTPSILALIDERVPGVIDNVTTTVISIEAALVPHAFRPRTRT